VDVAAIPYKSMPPVLGDLIGGRLDFAFVDLTSAHGHIKGGQLKPIAFTLTKRSSQMPDLPTVAETPGFSGYEVTSWIGLVGPAGVPRSIVEPLNAEINRILARQDIRDKLAELGAETAPGSPDDFAAFIRQQLESWRTKIAAAGIQPE
jgi:tripartite-type tricarboxylate transporter receptor subunit TctC